MPAAIALVVLGFFWLGLPQIMGKRKGWTGHGPRFVLPVLVGGLTLFGAYAWQSQVELWPDSATHRFPALGILAAAVGLIATLPVLRSRWWTLGPIAAAGGGAAAWMFLATVHPSFLSEGERALWIGVVALATGVNGWALERTGERLAGWRGPALLWMLVGTIGLGATAGFANAPLIVGGAVAAFGALALVGFVSGRVSIAGGGGVSAAVLIGGLVSFSNWLGDTERWLMLGLLLAAPAATSLALLVDRKGGEQRRKTLTLIVAAVPSLGLAGAQAAMTVPELISSQSGEDYLDY